MFLQKENLMKHKGKTTRLSFLTRVIPAEAGIHGVNSYRHQNGSRIKCGMTLNIYTTALLFFLFFITISPSYANASDPSFIGIGARSLGLGGAYTSLPNDNGIFLNPAGLANLNSWQTTSMTSNLIGDITTNVIGTAVPFGYGAVSIGYISSFIDGFILTAQQADNEPTPIGTSSYTNTSLLIGYGLPLQIFSQDVSFGSRLKFLNQQFQGSVINGQGAQGMDLDLGILAEPYSWLSVGLTAQNILPSQLGGKMKWDDGHEESLASLIKLGSNIKNNSINWLIDADYSPSQSNPILLHTGLEYYPLDLITLRAGIDQSWDANGLGSMSINNNLTLGVGLNIGSFKFDYAFHKFSDIDGFNSHFFSIGYRGKPNVSKQTNLRYKLKLSKVGYKLNLTKISSPVKKDIKRAGL
jgi:hypothetical protein